MFEPSPLGNLQLKGCMEGPRKWLFRPNFFPRPNELNFCMWPSTSEKNIPPYFSLLVSLSFSTNNICKNAVFFLVVSFPKKAFVFPNNRISEACICCQGWFKKISRKPKTKQQKKLRGNVFLLSPRSHAKKKLSSFRGKTKNRPKKSLTWFFHAALQFILAQDVLALPWASGWLIMFIADQCTFSFKVKVFKSS